MSKHPHFTFGEMLRSETATKKRIDNTITSQDIEDNLEALMTNVLEPARQIYGAAINVTSGYRCDKLNKAVGGVSNSQHRNGEACDLQCSNLQRLFGILMNLPHDQLLFERSGKTQWIHVSYKRIGKNRNQTIENYVV